ncbi:MAG: hypothetical protein FWE82_09870 [Defluviitaleaceae bacterium]|nr:hypothetical protein [Defluviitaleaceae bacterium]
MTSRERIYNTLDRKPVDCAPYSFDITSHVAQKLEKHYKAEGRLFEFIGDDLLFVHPGGENESIELPQEFLCEDIPDSYRDEFGVVWDKNSDNSIGDWGDILFHPLKNDSLDGYKFPAGAKKSRYVHFDTEWLAKQDRFVISGLPGLFTRCWFMRGIENFLSDMVLNPVFTGKLLDNVLEYTVGMLEYMPDVVDGVRIGEDWGLQKGLVTGAPLWRKFLKPRLKILYEAVRKKGLRLFLHSCGDIAEIFPDLIEMGVEAVNPVQPEAMDINFLHREYGRDLTMYGGLGSQSTLVYGDASEVIAEADRLLELFSGGGLIIGPAGAIPTDANITSVIALIDHMMAIKSRCK